MNNILAVPIVFIGLIASFGCTEELQPSFVEGSEKGGYQITCWENGEEVVGLKDVKNITIKRGEEGVQAVEYFLPDSRKDVLQVSLQTTCHFGPNLTS